MASCSTWGRDFRNIDSRRPKPGSRGEENPSTLRRSTNSLGALPTKSWAMTLIGGRPVSTQRGMMFWFAFRPCFFRIGAAVVTKSNSLDIFVVDTGGNIQKSHWQPGLAAWTTWLALPFGHTTPGTALSVVSRAPGLMDLFFVAADGYVWSAAFDPAIGTWQGPWRLHVDLPMNPLEPIAVSGTIG